MTRARTPRPHEVEDARRDQRLLRAMREGGSDPAWRTRGVCQSVDPEMFFPAPSEPADAAVELCRTCPVQGSCLAWALQVGDLHGVWGGTTARERRAMSVVWRGWRHEPVGEDGAVAATSVPETTVPQPATVSATAVGGPAVAGSPAVSSAVPSPRTPTELAELGTVADRAELLRLVRAG